MRAKFTLVFLASLGLWTCKQREAELGLLSAAESEAAAAPAGCEKLGDGGAISEQKLLQRAANPACRAKFLATPLVRQTKGFTCGAASLQSVLFFWGDFYPEGILQRLLKAHKENGTSFKRILKFVRSLNVAASRAAFDKVSGFDEAVELSDLRTVLASPEVQAALKKQAKKPAFASVLAGIKQLEAEDVDIDKLSEAAGLRLTGDAPAGNAGDAGGHHDQPNTPKTLKTGEYAAEVFVDQTPFNGEAGVSTTGCPAGSPPAAGPFQKNAMTVQQLEEAINAGTPVIALTQAWTFSSDADYDVNEYEKAWYSGHYVVITGYDDDNIYLMDPYNMGHYAFVPRAEFMKRWHDYDGLLSKDYTRCAGGVELRNFGLVVRRAGGGKYVQDQVTKMY